MLAIATGAIGSNGLAGNRKPGNSAFPWPHSSSSSFFPSSSYFPSTSESSPSSIFITCLFLFFSILFFGITCWLSRFISAGIHLPLHSVNRPQPGISFPCPGRFDDHVSLSISFGGWHSVWKLHRPNVRDFQSIEKLLRHRL